MVGSATGADHERREAPCRRWPGYPLWHAARAELLAPGLTQAQRRLLEARLGEAAQAEVDLQVGDRVDDP
jgi:hypothetical protein